jgi:hypothetical protein
MGHWATNASARNLRARVCHALAITASSAGRAGSEADNAPPSFRVLKLLFSTFAPDCSLPTKPAFGNPGPVQGAHAAEISERLTYG